MDGPHTRGLAARDALDRLDDFERDLQSRVRALVPASSLSIIESTPPLGWVSVEHEHHVTRSIFAVLDERGVEYFRWLVARHFIHTPLMRPVVDKMQRLFGLDPGSLLRVAPLAWDLMFRGFGRIVPAERGPQRANVDLVDCTPAVFDYPDYVRSWVGVFEATFDIAQLGGVLEHHVDEPGRAVRFALQW
jgi:hypothetical protein